MEVWRSGLTQSFASYWDCLDRILAAVIPLQCNFDISAYYFVRFSSECFILLKCIQARRGEISRRVGRPPRTSKGFDLLTHLTGRGSYWLPHPNVRLFGGGRFGPSRKRVYRGAVYDDKRGPYWLTWITILYSPGLCSAGSRLRKNDLDGELLYCMLIYFIWAWPRLVRT